ncbi:MAG TPA: SEC-C metal-binding domain-containing protein, partial [Methylophilaceae bacterium]|nr:SEC-C metal-binding domain-containing protein [Methylophilaceae bacterium]
HLRSYAQKNPKQEYKREAFELFEGLLNTVKSEVTKVTMLVQVRTQEDVDAVEPPQSVENVQYKHADYNESQDNNVDEDAGPASRQPVVREGQKIGRNDPCPCGSGKKYKQCHGALS